MNTRMLIGVLVGSMWVVNTILPADKLSRDADPAGAFYTNPLDVKIADPFILQEDGQYFLYGTSSFPPDTNRGIPVFSSKDLVSWRSLGLSFEKAEGDWGDHWFWAGRVYRIGGRYLMYGNAHRWIAEGRRTSAIVVRASDRPEGPFREVKAPLFDWTGRGAAIDPCVFIDEDGSQYVYFSGVRGRPQGVLQVVYGAPLAEDGLSLLAPPERMIVPEQDWEMEQEINEGPKVIRRGDTYYMFYAGNDFRNPNYAVGYATAPHPLGPWTKASENPVIRAADGLRGPGIATFTVSPDGTEEFVLYHTHAEAAGYIRQLNMSRVQWAAVAGGPDRPVIEPVGRDLRRIPSGAAPRPTVVSDTFSEQGINWSYWLVLDEAAGRWRWADGAIWIRPARGDMANGRADQRNMFLQLLPFMDFTASVRIEFEPVEDFEQASLVIWQDHDHYIRLTMLFADGPRIELAYEMGKGATFEQVENSWGTSLYLRVRRADRQFLFDLSPDGTTWHAPFDSVEARFPLPRIGFLATNPVRPSEIEARFSDWRFEPTD